MNKELKYSIGENKMTNNYDVVVDFGDQPWGNDYRSPGDHSAPNYPLKLLYFHDASLLQLDTFVPKEVMFTEHTYISGMTRSLIDHFYKVAKDNKYKFKIDINDIIVDVGGNDGSQLLQYKKLGYNNLFNIEPASNIAQISRDAGINVINEFATKEVFIKNFNKGTVKLINASGVFFHMEDLHSVIEGIVHALADDGVLNIQFMYAGAMIENKSYDMIYHEHLCYYTIDSICKLLRPYGLYIKDAYLSAIHSGSIISTFVKDQHRYVDYGTLNLIKKDRKYDYKSFVKMGEDAIAHARLLNSFVSDLQKTSTIYAMGAPVKGSTLLNTSKIDHNIIKKAVEINKLKIGKLLPGTNILVEEESKDDYPDYYLILSHNFADEIIAKNQDFKNKGGKFIIPFPEITIR